VRFNRRKQWTPDPLNYYWWHPRDLISLADTIRAVYDDWKAWDDTQPREVEQ
jgi:hypothetical protein